jgi:hypothetical protein
VVAVVAEGSWHGGEQSSVDGGFLSCGYLLWKGCSKRGKDEGFERTFYFCLTLER